MIDPNTFEKFTQRIMDSVPASARNLQDDLEKNLRAGLSSAFGKLNLVTREEFEVQTAVLARTRLKLHTLEAQVAALETRLGVIALRPGGDPNPEQEKL